MAQEQQALVAGTAALVAPGSAQAFVWQEAAAAGVWAVDDAALAGMPRLMLLPQCTVTITVTGLQAGDQLSQIALVREMYPPRDTEAGAVAYPVLEALQELNVLCTVSQSPNSLSCMSEMG